MQKAIIKLVGIKINGYICRGLWHVVTDCHSIIQQMININNYIKLL